MRPVHAPRDGYSMLAGEPVGRGSTRAPGTARHRLYAAVGCTAALVLVGGVLATRVTGGEDRSTALHPAALVRQNNTDIGRDISTSFGVVAAESVRALGGLGARPLAGVTHGIQNLVRPDQMQVQVLVALTNELSRTVRYAPQQFRLRVGARTRRVLPRGATFHPGILQPRASIEGNVVFVAPRTRAPLVLEFADARGPIAIDLGRATPGRAPPSYAHQH